MENAIEIQVSLGTRNEGPVVDGFERTSAKALKLPSIREWYRILRVHHHCTIFQAIRFALWLAR